MSRDVKIAAAAVFVAGLGVLTLTPQAQAISRGGVIAQILQTLEDLGIISGGVYTTPTLATVLASGNTSGGTGLTMSDGDVITVDDGTNGGIVWPPVVDVSITGITGSKILEFEDTGAAGNSGLFLDLTTGFSPVFRVGSGGQLIIDSETAGADGIEIQPNNGETDINGVGSERIRITGNGGSMTFGQTVSGNIGVNAELTYTFDNANDLGSYDAGVTNNRPRTLYLGTSMELSDDIVLSSSGANILDVAASAGTNFDGSVSVSLGADAGLLIDVNSLTATDATTAATAGETLNLESGDGSTSGAGGLLTVAAGAGGATGAGGAVSIVSGAGGATSGNSGAVTLDAGAVTSGTAGTVTIAGTNASGLTIGRSGIDVDTAANLRQQDDSRHIFGTGSDVFTQGEISTLTDNVATEVCALQTADNDAGGIVITYFVRATDGTENQSETGTVVISVIDDAGGVVASTPLETSGQALSSGTLTTDWAISVVDDGDLEITLDADSSLTTTTFTVRWHAVVSGDMTLVVP